ADGMTFVIQSDARGTRALGPGGGGLGYGEDHPNDDTDPTRIRNSVAIKFDIYNNAGEGIDSTGIFTDGRSPTIRADGLPPNFPDQTVDLTGSGIDWNTQHVFRVRLTYAGTTLTEVITDTTTMASRTVTYNNVNIPALVGGNLAYVGFTGGTGGL